MRINGMSNMMQYNSYNQNKILAKLASGKRINSAADDAAGLGIVQNMNAQTSSLAVTNNNISDSKNMLNVAEGGLSSISDNLQRMKELATQASNGIYSSDDKAMLQDEINQLKDQINSTTQGTSFNGLNPLDGNQVSLNGTAATPTFDSLASSLGIDGFDVTGSFDIADIDKAIDKVSSMRSDAGASYNSMSHTTNYNSSYELNLTEASSRLEDADIAKMAMEFRKSDLFQQVNINTQKTRQQTVQNYMGSLLNLMV